jgi:thiamine kinase-like enzyme
VWSEEALIGVAHLVRQYHDAVATFVPPVDAAWQFSDTVPRESEIICHNDLAPWNTVFHDGAPVAFIDWDLASPGLRVWDVAFVVWHFVPLYDDEKCARLGCLSSLDEKARRLRRFCDAYECAPTGTLLAEVVQRQRRARERIRRLAEEGHGSGIRLWQSGVGETILREVAFVERNSLALARYLAETP